MNIWKKILKLNFEYRVIISYLIFAFALITLIFSKNYTYNIIADYLKINRQMTMIIVFWIIGIINLTAWVFRSYAGGFLTGHVAVTKTVQTYRLVTTGPFAYVRNPLYLSDIISMTSIGLAGPPIAVFILFFGKLITSFMYTIYEEKELFNSWGNEYQHYKKRVPRFIPRITPYKNKNLQNIKINLKDGLAYNFYACGIGIAFIITSFTQKRIHLYIFGFITPILWFFLRFIDRHIRKIVK
tara:strand:- start:20909 stop:21631 length:723 start_codon:yes stop_codon:yes gene_type:complete